MVSTLKGKQQLPAITDLFYCYEVAKKGAYGCVRLQADSVNVSP